MSSTTTKFIPVTLESPYGGDVERNLVYLRRALSDSLHRGEAPFAPHGLYTQPGVLRDWIQEERDRGINAGLAIAALTLKTVVYTDLGITPGMLKGINHAQAMKRPVEYRSIL